MQRRRAGFARRRPKERCVRHGLAPRRRESRHRVLRSRDRAERTTGTNETFPDIYVRTLPDLAESAWDFSSWTPDAVVISLGGSESRGGQFAGFVPSGYDALITSIRGRHPNAHIYMTIWSQIKDLGAGQNYRTMLKSVLDGIRTAHPTDTKLHVFAWNEADHERDETGCEFHANAEHGIETAHELAPVIASDLGW